MLRHSAELYLRAQGFLPIELNRAASMLPTGWELDRVRCTCRPSATEGTWVAALALTAADGRSIEISSGVRRAPDAAREGAIEAISTSRQILHWLGRQHAASPAPIRAVQPAGTRLPPSAIMPLRPLLLPKRGCARPSSD